MTLARTTKKPTTTPAATTTIIRLAPGQGRVKNLFKQPSSHPQIDSLFFILPLLDLSSIPRAREGGPWGLPAPKSDRGSWEDRSSMVANLLFRVFFVFLRFFFVFQFFIQNCSFTNVLALRGAHFLPRRTA